MADMRDLYDEVATLRQELAEAIRERDAKNAYLAAEVEALKGDLKEARDERDKAVTERDQVRRERDRARRALAEHVDCDECQPEIQAALGLAPDPVEVAARHAVACYRQGNIMGTVVAVARLGEVLDGGT